MAIILLTGATGFLGRAIAGELVRAGHEVRCLIRAADAAAAKSRLADVARGQKLGDSARLVALHGDLAAPELGLSAADRASALEASIVVHAGAPMDIDLDLATALRVIEGGTEALLALAAARRERGEPLRFVHVVGYMSPVTDENAADPALEAVFEAQPPYERLKFRADAAVRRAARELGFELTVLHPSTVVGSVATGETEQTGGFGLLVSSLRKGLMPFVPGGKDHWLPLVPLDRLARFTAEAATRPEAAGQTYFLLDPATPKLPTLLGAIAKELRVSAPVGALPLGLLRAGLKAGGAALTGLSANSLDFITTRRFPTASTERALREWGLPAWELAATLSGVVADLDARDVRPVPAAFAGFERVRLGALAAWVRPGAGVPWVGVHGALGCAEDWLPLAAARPEAPCVLLDLAGFGRSPHHHRPDGFDGHLEALLNALDALDGPYELVGHGFGALLAAEASRRRPRRTARLVLLEPPLGRSRPGGSLFGARARQRGGGPAGAAELRGRAARVRADGRSPRIRAANRELAQALRGHGGLDPTGLRADWVWGGAAPEAARRAYEALARSHGGLRPTAIAGAVSHLPLTHAEALAALWQAPDEVGA